MGDTASPEYVDRSFREALAETWPGIVLPTFGDSARGLGLRVVVGAGSVAPADWVCLDVREDYPSEIPEVVDEIRAVKLGRLCLDAALLLDRFGPGSCSAIYAHHVAEHLPIATWTETIRSLAEALRPGGLLYLSQPDLEAVAARTLEGIAPGSAAAWFASAPVSRTWPGETLRGLDPVAWEGGSFGAWEWIYCGGDHRAVPSEAHVRAAVEPSGVEVRRARFDLSRIDERYRRFVALTATYVCRRP